MSRLEQDLREEFARQVAAPPPLPHLADAVLRRGKRARSYRAVAAAGATAVVVAFALSASSMLPSLVDPEPDIASAALDGPPQVPLYVGQEGVAEVLDWPGGTQRSRPLGEPVQPVAQVPAGLLVVLVDAQPALGLLGRDDDEPRRLVDGLAAESVAVSDDGQRAAVVVTADVGRRLQEVELPSGRVLRSVELASPTFADAVPVAYSAGAVLLTVGEGSEQRSALWERGDNAVAAPLDGFTGAVGGSDAEFSSDRDAVGGRAAFTVRDDRCHTEVHQLRNGDGSPWRLCGEVFIGFSPDGQAVLATAGDASMLLVHDADDGSITRTLEVPQGLRAYGWESDDTVLYTTRNGPKTVVIRCSVDTGACATAAEFPDNDSIPQPVRSIG